MVTEGDLRGLLAHVTGWRVMEPPTASRVTAGADGECFENAARLAAETGLRYFEGLAVCARNPEALHHAWCVDEDGEVVDPTWTDGVVYLGRETMFDRVD